MRRSGFKRRPTNKYRAIRTKIGDQVFDSRLEAEHYLILKDKEKCGEIIGLETQHELSIGINNKHICIYIADYFYFDNSAQRWVVSDAKGVETEVFKLKWKLVKALYPEFIFEKRKKWKVTRETA
jgi:hypothetical protein